MSKTPLTIEAFAEWAEKQPAEKEYEFLDSHGCACFQYLSAIGMQVRAVGSSHWCDTSGREHSLPFGFNRAANGYGEPRNFGALAARLRALSA